MEVVSDVDVTAHFSRTLLTAASSLLGHRVTEKALSPTLKLLGNRQADLKKIFKLFFELQGAENRFGWFVRFNRFYITPFSRTG